MCWWWRRGCGWCGGEVRMAVADTAAPRWWATLPERAGRWAGEVLAHVAAMARNIGEAAGLLGEDDEARVNGRMVKLPQWLVLYLLGQLIGGIWWAATLQADVRYLQGENVKLWNKMEVLELRQGRVENGFDEKVRQKVRETMDDAGYLRVRPGRREGD